MALLNASGPRYTNGMTTAFDEILQQLDQRRNLSMDQMALAIDLMMQGGCDEAQIGRLLTALAAKGETVEEIAGATGLPVGIKSAVGEEAFWRDLVHQMVTTGRGVDFVTVDGGEGGTGAAPLVYSDHVALPFKWGFPRVYRAFAEADLHEQVVFVGSGKLGLPENALLALALGCDLVNVGRTAMFALGCVQAQRCHTGRCPT
ncbi:MAG: hypothetical protein KDA37_11700, partial [Planctomycetales bacterium]|nr:hypothetical protein [Planctomycetales bacterium]